MRRALALLVGLMTLAVPLAVRAQCTNAPAPPPVYCIPGTTICAGGNGQGGLGGGGNAGGQVGPNGASGNANGNGGGGGNANGGASGPCPPTPPPPPPPTPTRPPPPRPPPPQKPPPPPPPPTNVHPLRHGPWGTGFSMCGAVRVGFWSGVHYGGCLMVPYRTRTIGLDVLETQVMGGGELSTIDLVVSPVSGLIKLAPDDAVWGGLYLRVGPQLGYSFPQSDDAYRYFRFGGHAGVGYELDVASNVALRVLDARLVAEATGNRADREGHRFDLGVLLSTGIVFK